MSVEDGICQWCGSSDIVLHRNQVKVINAQVDFPHALSVCQACNRLNVSTSWGDRLYVYRALYRKRVLLPDLYMVIHAITCAWCGSDEEVEPEDINAPIANPASGRDRYDVYKCAACRQYTAVSYVGELFTYRAVQDEKYTTLYHLNIEHV